MYFGSSNSNREPMKKIILLALGGAIFAACSEKEPPVGNLTKDHSIEVTYETKHLNDTSVLLIRRENVFLKGKMIKSFYRTDTLPAPGDTIHSVEQEDESTLAVPAPKEYEFFVTVK